MAHWEIYVLLKYFLIQAGPTMKLHAHHIFKGEIIILENILKHQSVKEHLPKCFQMPMHDCKYFFLSYIQTVGFPGGSVVKSLPAKQETWVQALGWEVPLQEELATHSSILAWRISWAEEPDGLQSMGSKESDTTLQLNNNTYRWLRTELHLETRQWVFFR